MSIAALLAKKKKERKKLNKLTEGLENKEKHTIQLLLLLSLILKDSEQF